MSEHWWALPFHSSISDDRCISDDTSGNTYAFPQVYIWWKSMLSFSMIPLVKECESIKYPLCQWGLKYNFKIKKITITLFHVCVPFLYPLKTSENLWFSDVFRGYKNVTLLVWKELTHFRPVFPFYAPWKDQKISSFGLKWNFFNLPFLNFCYL